MRSTALLLALLGLLGLPGCVEVSIGCSTDADCAGGQRCVAGSCATPPAARCGDGLLDADLGEACDAGDEGNGQASTGCTTECAFSCGDGVLDPSMGESCDDGPLNGDARGSCSTSCVRSFCGDGVVQPERELCDVAVQSTWCGTTCRRACDGGRVRACASAGLSAAVTADGALFTWGANDQGQLGRASAGPIDPQPGRVLPERLWGSVACGDGFVLALELDGTAWSWGTPGEWLGRGADLDPAPARLEGQRWRQLSTSGRSVLGIDSLGALYFWGVPGHGSDGLSQDHQPPIASPVRIDVSKSDWRSVAAGPQDTSFAIDESGTLFAWGRNDHGQLGQGDRVGRGAPEPVPAAALGRVAAVAAGSTHTLALGADGRLWAFGDGAGGQLGRPGAEGDATAPVRFGPEGTLFSSAAAGDASSFGVTTDAQLLGAGRNAREQVGVLGLGSAAVVETPTRVGAAEDLRVGPENSVAVGPGHTLISPRAAGLLVTGADRRGALGEGAAVAFVPRPVASLCGCESDEDCAGGGVCRGGSCTASCGALDCTDPGAREACGDGELQPERGERCDDGPANGSGVGHCAAGCGEVLRCGDGALDPLEECDPPIEGGACDGSCTIPRCGDGVVLAPEAADPGDSCAACALGWPRPGGRVAAVGGRSMYVDPDGRLWVFGSNAGGSLGWSPAATAPEDEAPDLTRPARAPFPGPVRTVALSYDRSFVVDRAGFLWSLGLAGPALGLGPPMQGASLFVAPSMVSGPASWASVTAAGTCTLALDRGGVPWFFGMRPCLWEGTTEEVSVPEPLALSRITSVTLGNQWAHALNEEGEVLAWGRNSVGQLGLPAGAPVEIPTRVLGLPPIRSVASGTGHTLFLARDGRLFGAGQNQRGQLCRETTGAGGIQFAGSGPIELQWGAAITRIAAGGNSSLALDVDGAGFGCGHNSAAELPSGANVLGIDDPTDQYAPAPIHAQGRRLVEVATSGAHSLFLDDGGHLLATGHGPSGELGLGPTVQLDHPTEIPVPCD